MKLQSNFQPDIPSKAVSTLLEILEKDLYDAAYDLYGVDAFQPFLRFWFDDLPNLAPGNGSVSTLLEILDVPIDIDIGDIAVIMKFQPFLRFWGSRLWLLWVFKFFCCFLQIRRSAWNHALHSFHTALGESETPFFGASRKRRREKSGKERYSSQLGFVGRMWSLSTGLSS